MVISFLSIDNLEHQPSQPTDQYPNPWAPPPPWHTSSKTGSKNPSHPWSIPSYGGRQPQPTRHRAERQVPIRPTQLPDNADSNQDQPR